MGAVVSNRIPRAPLRVVLLVEVPEGLDLHAVAEPVEQGPLRRTPPSRAGLAGYYGAHDGEVETEAVQSPLGHPVDRLEDHEVGQAVRRVRVAGPSHEVKGVPVDVARGNVLVERHR